MPYTEDMLRASTDEVIKGLAYTGDEGAIAEAGRRGLEAPVAGAPHPADREPTGYAEERPLGWQSDDDEPDLGSLPVESLIWLRDEGNADAAAELHRRYPYTYDETGHETEISKARDRAMFPSMFKGES